MKAEFDYNNNDKELHLSIKAETPEDRALLAVFVKQCKNGAGAYLSSNCYTCHPINGYTSIGFSTLHKPNKRKK